MGTDPLRRLQEELRQVESPEELPPDLLYALETLAAAFGTSLEAMRDRIIYASSRNEPVIGFMKSVPTGRDIQPMTQLATLVSQGRATLPVTIHVVARAEPQGCPPVVGGSARMRVC
jgi:hypothetical protein